jgi:uncharacterized protein
MSYNSQQQQTLLNIARYSIAQGLKTGQGIKPEISQYDEALQHNRASFVTLHKNQQLRGCIGNLQASRPLIQDVSENAYAAAFRDPRFPAVTAAELDQLHISISVLTPATPIHFTSEQDLIEQLKPGEDGLILTEGARRGTFLPSVWQQLPRAQEFLQHLKIKAGLPASYWSDNIQISRYHTETIE